MTKDAGSLLDDPKITAAGTACLSRNFRLCCFGQKTFDQSDPLFCLIKERKPQRNDRLYFLSYGCKIQYYPFVDLKPGIYPYHKLPSERAEVKKKMRSQIHLLTMHILKSRLMIHIACNEDAFTDYTTTRKKLTIKREDRRQTAISRK